MKEVLDAIENLEFVYAKTMPQMPHFYTVKIESNKEFYETLFMHILQNGYDKEFHGKNYRYCDIGTYQYWIMSDDISISKIINRRKLAE